MADIKRFIGTWKVNWGNGFYSSISKAVIDEKSEHEALAKFYRTAKAPPALSVDLRLTGDILVGSKRRGGREYAFEIFPAFQKELIGASQRAPGSGVGDDSDRRTDDPDNLAGTWGAEDVGGGHGVVDCVDQRQARAS